MPQSSPTVVDTNVSTSHTSSGLNWLATRVAIIAFVIGCVVAFAAWPKSPRTTQPPNDGAIAELLLNLKELGPSNRTVTVSQQITGHDINMLCDIALEQFLSNDEEGSLETIDAIDDVNERAYAYTLIIEQSLGMRRGEIEATYLHTPFNYGVAVPVSASAFQANDENVPTKEQIRRATRFVDAMPDTLLKVAALRAVATAQRLQMELDKSASSLNRARRIYLRLDDDAKQPDTVLPGSQSSLLKDEPVATQLVPIASQPAAVQPTSPSWLLLLWPVVLSISTFIVAKVSEPFLKVVGTVAVHSLAARTRSRTLRTVLGTEHNAPKN